MNAESLHLTLEKFRKDGAHLLLPSTFVPEIPKFHSVAIDQIYLSSDTKEGDVYLQQKKLALTRQGLMKLANAAGMIWDPNRSKRLDDRRDKNYVVYQSVGGYRKLDGTPLFMKAEYDLDFEILEEEIQEGYEGKRAAYEKDPKNNSWFCNKTESQKQAYIDKCIRRDLLQKRKHKIKLAETGAMTRVIRGLLSLKASYTEIELEKPFIVVRLIFQPDYNDPETKRQIAAASVSAITGVFGQGHAVPALPEGPSCNVPAQEIEEAPMDEDNGEIPTGAEDEPGPEDEDPEFAKFISMSQKARLDYLPDIAKPCGFKNYREIWKYFTIQTGKAKPVNPLEMPEEDIVELFELLRNCPEPGSSPTVTDDIPF